MVFLTHYCLNKMAPILLTTFQVFVLNKNVCIFHQISLKFDYRDPVGNKSTLVQLMAWHFFSTMPLTNGDLWYCQYYWSPIYSFWPGHLSVLKSVAIGLLNDAFGLDNELSVMCSSWMMDGGENITGELTNSFVEWTTSAAYTLTT